MAGNIIPAIATTNAVIAGCIVMEAIKILNNQVFIKTFFYAIYSSYFKKEAKPICDFNSFSVGGFFSVRLHW